MHPEFNQDMIAVLKKITSAQILPTVEMVSIGYSPRRVSAPRRIASLPATDIKGIKKEKTKAQIFHVIANPIKTIQ